MIEDDGPGITGANAEHVFDPFFTTRREDGGTGMGLAIVRTMLQAEGFDIEFVPSGGLGGARFEVAF